VQSVFALDPDLGVDRSRLALLARPLDLGQLGLIGSEDAALEAAAVRHRDSGFQAEVDAECLRAWDDASRLLESLGHEVVDIEPPLTRDAVPVFETNWAVLTALSTINLPEEAKEQIRPLTRWLGELGEKVSGPHFGLALGELRRVAARTLATVAPYDAVLTPTLATPPLPVGALRDDADPAADFEAQKRFTPWTSIWNVTGSPAVSLPLHQTRDGLPVGVMLAARPGEEGLLLALAAQVEAAAPWLDRHPPCW